MLVRRLLAPMILLEIISAVIIASPRPTFAASEGCTNFAGFPSTLTSPYTFSGYVFEAGDTISFSIGSVQTGSTTARLEVNGAEVDSVAVGSSLSGIVEYVIPSDGTYNGRLLNDAGVNFLNTKPDCVPAPDPGPTTPAPTAEAPGPGIPSDFVLRTITCDTPLFTTPGGSPVPGGAAVTAGQTWFLAPEADEETPGFIEGFFGGETNAWLPTACVG